MVKKVKKSAIHERMGIIVEYLLQYDTLAKRELILCLHLPDEINSYMKINKALTRLIQKGVVIQSSRQKKSEYQQILAKRRENFNKYSDLFELLKDTHDQEPPSSTKIKGRGGGSQILCSIDKSPETIQTLIELFPDNLTLQATLRSTDWVQQIILEQQLKVTLENKEIIGAMLKYSPSFFAYAIHLPDIDAGDEKILGFAWSPDPTFQDFSENLMQTGRFPKFSNFFHFFSLFLVRDVHEGRVNIDQQDLAIQALREVVPPAMAKEEKWVAMDAATTACTHLLYQLFRCEFSMEIREDWSFVERFIMYLKSNPGPIYKYFTSKLSKDTIDMLKLNENDKNYYFFVVKMMKDLNSLIKNPEFSNELIKLFNINYKNFSGIPIGDYRTNAELVHFNRKIIESICFPGEFIPDDRPGLWESIDNIRKYISIRNGMYGTTNDDQLDQVENELFEQYDELKELLGIRV